MFRAHLCAGVLLVLAGLSAGASALAHGPSPHPAATPGEPAEASLFARTPEFDYDPPEPGTYELPPLRDAVDGAVLDSNGKALRLSGVRHGKITLLSFIYTNCTDDKGCPLASAVLSDILLASTRDSNLAEHLKIVSLSFDAVHDTPKVMADYAAPLLAPFEGRRRSEWAFLTAASERELKHLLAGYDQFVIPNLGPDKILDGTFEHLLRVYLVDRSGRVRNVYGVSLLDPRLLIADVKTLLMEERDGIRQ